MSKDKIIKNLTEENALLKAQLSKYEETISKLESKIEALERNEKIYLEALSLAKKKQFGSSSEKTPQPEYEELGFFNESELEYTDNPVEPVVKTQQGIKKKEPKSGRERLIDKNLIETKIVNCTLPADKRKCPACGEEMSKIGMEFVREDVQLIPAKLVVRRYFRESYECRKCKIKNKPVIIKARVPQPVLAHSLASASTVAHVMYQKYVQAVPLYRQEKDWLRLGFDLSRSTMANWVIRSCEDWLEPLVDRMKLYHLLKESILHCDETPVQVLKEEGKKAESKSYMWVYRTGKYAEKQIVIYDYNKSRSGEVPKKFLGDFDEYFHTDGYAGYNNLHVTRCSCWAHMRRYWCEAIIVEVPGAEKSSAEIGRDFCDKLFHIESQLENMTSAERKEERIRQEKPLLEAYWCWVENLNALKGTRLEKAVTYAKNQKKYLENYLLDGKCVISNNLAENAIRPFTIGRKNWLFCDSVRGAKASAAVYSLIETAKTNNLDVFDYLEYLLTMLPSIDFRNHPEYLDDYLPWGKCVADYFERFKA